MMGAWQKRSKHILHIKWYNTIFPELWSIKLFNSFDYVPSSQYCVFSRMIYSPTWLFRSFNSSPIAVGYFFLPFQMLLYTLVKRRLHVMLKIWKFALGRWIRALDWFFSKSICLLSWLFIAFSGIFSNTNIHKH